MSERRGKGKLLNNKQVKDNLAACKVQSSKYNKMDMGQSHREDRRTEHRTTWEIKTQKPLPQQKKKKIMGL